MILLPQPRLALLIAGLAGLPWVTLVAGLAMHDGRAAWLLLLPLVLRLAWRGARIEARLLHWDGQCWRLAPAAAQEPCPAVRLEVLDLDRWLLLRAQVPDAAAGPLHRRWRIYPTCR